MVMFLWTAAAAIAGQACAQSQNAMDVFVSSRDARMHDLHGRANGNAARILAGCRELLPRFLKLDAMAHAAGEDFWDKLSDEQRKTYRAAFADRMVTECGRQFANYKGEDIRELGNRTVAGGDKLVMTRVGRGDDAKQIGWRMRRDPSPALHLIVAGTSASSHTRPP